MSIMETGQIPGLHNLLMEKSEVRAIANYLRAFYDADSFLRAIEHARTLSEEGKLQGAPVWNQIAEEISQIETSDALEQLLAVSRTSVAKS